MKGMGRVYQRGSTWWVEYWHRGKQYRESLAKARPTVAQTEKQAWKLIKDRIGELAAGKFVARPKEERVTFEDLAEDLLNHYRANEQNLDAVKYPVARLRGSFGFDRALDITTDRIRQHIAKQQEAGAANGTINRDLAALKKMFSLALEANSLSRKPHIPTLEENNARQGFLDHGSFLALREALPEYLKDPVTFLYLSGWRKNEMQRLEWRDVDLAGQVVRLRPEISKNKDGRVLPLRGELLEILERARARRRLDCPRVFHLDGQPIGDFKKAWKTACKAAGLNGIIVHDLRRTAVRNMVRAGIHERLAMALSGHKTRAIFDRYNIVSEADLLEAAEKIHGHLERQPVNAVVIPVMVGVKSR
jgi:integrase